MTKLVAMVAGIPGKLMALALLAAVMVQGGFAQSEQNLIPDEPVINLGALTEEFIPMVGEAIGYGLGITLAILAVRWFVRWIRKG